MANLSAIFGNTAVTPLACLEAQKLHYRVGLSNLLDTAIIYWYINWFFEKFWVEALPFYLL